MVVVDGPEGREVARSHGGEEVLAPATLQVHEAPQAPLGVGSHHLQTVRHVRLVKNPSEERGVVRGGVQRRHKALPAGNQLNCTLNCSGAAGGHDRRGSRVTER